MAKLIVCFAHRDDAARLVSALQETEMRVTEPGGLDQEAGAVAASDIRRQPAPRGPASAIRIVGCLLIQSSRWPASIARNTLPRR